MKKDVASQQAKKKRKSLLSMQMESVTKVPSNPFHHFAKCDGEVLPALFRLFSLRSHNTRAAKRIPFVRSHCHSLSLSSLLFSSTLTNDRPARHNH